MKNITPLMLNTESSHKKSYTNTYQCILYEIAHKTT